MRHEIIDCLDFGIGKPFLLDVLTEKLLSFLKSENGLQTIKDEAENSLCRTAEVPALPLQDTFWSFTEIPLKHHDLSRLRMMVLSDSGISGSFTVQFSLEEAAQGSYQDQVLRLLYQGCLYPLDGRKSRRPRFVCLDSSQEASNLIQTDKDEMGIHFCGEMSSVGKLEALRKHFENATHFRQCSVCGISGTPDFLDDCDGCGALLYCGEKCKTDDWQESHQEWCSKFKEFMAVEPQLAELPFDFASVTTRLDFHEKRREEFLEEKFGICGQAQSQCENSCSRTDLLHSNRLSIINRNLDGLCLSGLEEDSPQPKVCPPPLDRPLNGWKDYYSLRGLSLHSLVAELLHFSLTLYYIITQRLPKDFEETFVRIQQSCYVCVYVIGAEKEVEMFYPFLECARLLAPLSMEVHLFGNNFNGDYHGQELKKENLRFKIHKGLYHQANLEDIPAPSLAVCFNGGIGAYTSYIKTIKSLMTNKTPLYYTDYGQACIMFSTRMITNSKAGHVSPLVINPFRSPLRMVASDQNLPRYSNAFITHIKPFS